MSLQFVLNCCISEHYLELIFPSQQVTGKGDPVITTTKCGRCKGTFRQMNDQVDTASTSQVRLCLYYHHGNNLRPSYVLD